MYTENSWSAVEGLVAWRDGLAVVRMGWDGPIFTLGAPTDGPVKSDWTNRSTPNYIVLI